MFASNIFSLGCYFCALLVAVVSQLQRLTDLSTSPLLSNLNLNNDGNDFNLWQKLGIPQIPQSAGGIAGGGPPLSDAATAASNPFQSIIDSTAPLSAANNIGHHGDSVDLQGISNLLPKLAPIPVPGYPGPQNSPLIPGKNTIPGLDMFNYLVGTLIPQAVAPANQLIGGSLSRILPQDQTQNLANNIFQALAAPPTNVDVDRMMGRWFEVINSPQVIREACTVSHYGALTNNSYSATFTILKFYREGNSHGSPRFSLGYGFKSGENGTFIIHNSNTPDTEPYWVVKVGPVNQFNQYEYAVISNWVRFPVLVLARDPEKFQHLYMREVLQYLEENNYINILTKALNMISPVDYDECQYTPTFSGAGK